jgi:16S rRNA (cytidine1402-2'-O)-methyltransferase
MDRQTGTGILYIVATPIGNLDDITRRAVHILADADAVVAEDTRKTSILLRHLAISKPLISYHTRNERRRLPELISRLHGGESLAFVSDAGTPGISDPGYLVVRECIREGIPVVPIPGASALLAGLTVSGLPMDRFVFEGFLPHRKGRKTRIESLKNEGRTIVFYESPHRIIRTLRELREVFGEREAVIGRELTKKFEEVVHGTLGELERYFEEKTVKGEFVLIVSGESKEKNRKETEV